MDSSPKGSRPSSGVGASAPAKQFVTARYDGARAQDFRRGSSGRLSPNRPRLHRALARSSRADPPGSGGALEPPRSEIPPGARCEAHHGLRSSTARGASEHARVAKRGRVCSSQRCSIGGHGTPGPALDRSHPRGRHAWRGPVRPRSRCDRVRTRLTRTGRWGRAARPNSEERERDALPTTPYRRSDRLARLWTCVLALSSSFLVERVDHGRAPYGRHGSASSRFRSRMNASG
jgi:hypothetical protein